MADIEIPQELPPILRNLTLSVLRNKPKDIVDYAVDYFVQLQRQRRSTVNEDEPTFMNHRDEQNSKSPRQHSSSSAAG